MVLASPLVWEHHPVFVGLPFRVITRRLSAPGEWVAYSLAYCLVFLLPAVRLLPLVVRAPGGPADLARAALPDLGPPPRRRPLPFPGGAAAAHACTAPVSRRYACSRPRAKEHVSRDGGLPFVVLGDETQQLVDAVLVGVFANPAEHDVPRARALEIGERLGRVTECLLPNGGEPHVEEMPGGGVAFGEEIDDWLRADHVDRVRRARSLADPTGHFLLGPRRLASRRPGLGA